MNKSEEQQLLEKVAQAWEITWPRFFRPETNLFYDSISSRDPAHCRDHLPTVDDELVLKVEANGRDWTVALRPKDRKAEVVAQ
jgi:hypothetical protein